MTSCKKNGLSPARIFPRIQTVLYLFFNSTLAFLIILHVAFFSDTVPYIVYYLGSLAAMFSTKKATMFSTKSGCGFGHKPLASDFRVVLSYLKTNSSQYSLAYMQNKLAFSRSKFSWFYQCFSTGYTQGLREGGSGGTLYPDSGLGGPGSRGPEEFRFPR